VERSRAALERADLALLVVDGSQPLTDADWDIAALLGRKPALVVANKTDLPQLELPADLLPSVPRLRVSALTGQGVEGLEEAVVELVFGGAVTAADAPLVSNPRHQASLKRALDHVEAAEGGQLGGLSPDLVSIDVREAVDALGEITGETVGEDLLEAIFSNFCIGK
jgi:tRNA modification GTPase